MPSTHRTQLIDRRQRRGCTHARARAHTQHTYTHTHTRLCWAGLLFRARGTRSQTPCSKGTRPRRLCAGPGSFGPYRKAALGRRPLIGVAAKPNSAHVRDSLASCSIAHTAESRAHMHACRSYYLKAASAAQCRAVVEALSNASRDARHAAEALSRMQRIQVSPRRTFAAAARDCASLRVRCRKGQNTQPTTPPLEKGGAAFLRPLFAFSFSIALKKRRLLSPRQNGHRGLPR